MFLANTIEVPVELAFYGIAGLAIFFLGLVVSRQLFTPVGYPTHVGATYPPQNFGCGFVILVVIIVAGAIAVFMTFPEVFGKMSGPVENDQTILLSSVTANTKRTDDIPNSKEIEPAEIFEPVENYSNEDLADFDHSIEELSSSEIEHEPPVEYVQVTASSRKDWAESRARKLRKEGYSHVTVLFKNDNTGLPWKIMVAVN